MNNDASANYLRNWDIQLPLNGRYIAFDSIDSTNVWLKEKRWEQHPEIEGILETNSLVISDAQSSGSGRFHRPWISPKSKNLYFSLWLKPQCELSHYSSITQIAAISLAQVLEEQGFPIQLKWPNDLLWNKHKICGILSELKKMDDDYYLILGIGLNVNSSAEDFEGLGRLASSLSIIKDETVDRRDILQTFLDHFFESLKQFEQNGFAPFLEKWKTMENFFNSPARLVDPGKNTEIKGHIMGINDDGSLQFKTENGQIQNIYSGDLEI